MATLLPAPDLVLFSVLLLRVWESVIYNKNCNSWVCSLEETSLCFSSQWAGFQKNLCPCCVPDSLVIIISNSLYYKPDCDEPNRNFVFLMWEEVWRKAVSLELMQSIHNAIRDSVFLMLPALSSVVCGFWPQESKMTPSLKETTFHSRQEEREDKE